jgi:nucleotide-binding universal stress UspA family protein
MSGSDPTLDPLVLVALDGSPAAATAMPLARVVARQLAAQIEVLHVAADQPPGAALWQRLHLGLEDLETVQVRSRAGEPAAGILEAAADPRVAVVVLTTHGRLVEPGRHLGRVAEAVIAATERPILLVRPEAATSAPGEVHRLLFPVDGTPTTAAALRPATELACRLGGSIDLLYVAGPDQPGPVEPGSIGAPRYVDQPQHEWPNWSREVIDRLCVCLANCPAEVPVRMALAQGEIGDEIARFAAEHASDAIVLVRRSQLEPGRGNVLRAVFDRTPCPVLLVSGPSG